MRKWMYLVFLFVLQELFFLLLHFLFTYYLLPYLLFYLLPNYKCVLKNALFLDAWPLTIKWTFIVCKAKKEIRKF